jgi:D-aminoacyl-tRNA deacylase
MSLIILRPMAQVLPREIQAPLRLKQERREVLKAVLQRVTSASVSISGEEVGRIGKGMVVLLGVAVGDTEEEAQYLVNKIINLRIFADESGKFNLSALDIAAELLLVSQFTLLADTKKGRRPGFTDAAPPVEADKLFQYFVARSRSTGLKVATGKFQAYMQVEIHNDGPVTIMLDSRDRPG